MTTNQILWLVGLITFVISTVIGQAELIGEPWRHYLTIASIVGTAISGYMLQHPTKEWDGTERRK